MREIDATLRVKGFKEVGPGPADYEGEIKVHGNTVTVRIEIFDPHFVKRPFVHLKDRSQINLETLAHIEVETGICYASAAGLPLDSTKPGEAILRVLKETEKTLERSYGGGAAQEIADEFQNYWKPKFVARSTLSTAHQINIDTVSLFMAERKGLVFPALCARPELGGYQVKALRSATIFHIAGRVGGASMKAAPVDIASLKAWWAAQSDIPLGAWDSVATALCKEHVCFVRASNAFIGFELQIPNDIETGIRNGKIRKQSVPKLLAGRLASLPITRWSADDCSIERVTQRNNPMVVGLEKKQIALIGCGTIGSHLARMLVQSGAGSLGPLYLFDDESLAVGNIGRHLLNFDDIGKNKACALAEELQRFHPNVTPHARPENALKSWAILQSCDLIIDATGDWNVQSALNELFLGRGDGAAVSALLHCWVFMNGAGSQSFLNLGDDRACFRCLKPEFAGPWRFPASKDNDELKLVAANCGDGTFVPFSVDAAMMAASLANRAALDWANGKPAARLRTVAVDLERGRYHKPVSPDPAKNCSVCREVRQLS